MQKKFEFSDYWLLFSIGFSRKGTTISRIISTGDHYNHAVFTYEELNDGLNKLIHNGYAVRSDATFCATKKAIDFNRQHTKFFEADLDSMIRVSELFGQLPMTAPTDYITYISEEEYHRIVY